MSIPTTQEGAEPCRNNQLNTHLSLTSSAVLWSLSRSQAPRQAALLKPTLVCCETAKESRQRKRRQTIAQRLAFCTPQPQN